MKQKDYNYYMNYFYFIGIVFLRNLLWFSWGSRKISASKCVLLFNVVK